MYEEYIMSLFNAIIGTLLMTAIHYIWLVLVSFKGDFRQAGVVLGHKSPVKIERMIAWASTIAGVITNVTVMYTFPVWALISFGIGFIAGPKLLAWTMKRRNINLF